MEGAECAHSNVAACGHGQQFAAVPSRPLACPCEDEVKACYHSGCLQAVWWPQIALRRESEHDTRKEKLRGLCVCFEVRSYMYM
jgi:hypothetical protein